jgi:hypothetical protein
MSFSIKAIIRGFVAPRLRLRCRNRLWRQFVSELEHRGHRRHESGMFLLGIDADGEREVREAVFYDDLDPRAYDTGVCILHGDAFAKLWTICRDKKLTVVADAHTHGGMGCQSSSDKSNPMVARQGHIAIILPDFARWPIRSPDLGIYEYLGQHEWINRSPAKTPGYFYTGLWS